MIVHVTGNSTTKEKENGSSESGPQQRLQTCIMKTMKLLNPERLQRLKVMENGIKMTLTFVVIVGISTATSKQKTM